METITELQERMISMVGALGNAADVSGARGFLRDFATDAGRIHRRIARITTQVGTDAHEVNEPVPATDPVAVRAPVSPAVVADNVPIAPPAATVNVPVEPVHVACKE